MIHAPLWILLPAAFVLQFTWSFVRLLSFQKAKRQGLWLAERGFTPERFEWRWHRLTGRLWIRMPDPDRRVGYIKARPW